jgi:hypothetical protein
VSNIVTHVTLKEGGYWKELKYPYDLNYILSLPIIQKSWWKSWGGIFHAVRTASGEIYDAVNGLRGKNAAN